MVFPRKRLPLPSQPAAQKSGQRSVEPDAQLSMFEPSVADTGKEEGADAALALAGANDIVEELEVSPATREADVASQASGEDELEAVALKAPLPGPSDDLAPESGPGRRASLIGRVPTTKQGEARLDTADDVAFEPTLDITVVARTAVRDATGYTEIKPNELAALLPSRPGLVLSHQAVKSYFLMHDYAIEQGLKDTDIRIFRVNLVRLEREGGFLRNDRRDLKKALRDLVGQSVEWNTPRVRKDGEVTVWEVSSMLAHVRFLYDKSHTLVLEWQYSDPLLEKLRLVGQFFKMHLNAIRETRTYHGWALYLYLSRYRTFPGQRTDAKPWREWVPILTGKGLQDWDEEKPDAVGNSWRYFNRDVIKRAVAEVNTIQHEYQAAAVFSKNGARVNQLWFTLKPIEKKAVAVADPPSANDNVLAARLVALDLLQRDAIKLLTGKNKAEVIQAIEYVERRLAMPTGQKILAKRAYFRTILAKIIAGELDATERDGEARNAKPPTINTLTDFDQKLRQMFVTWARNDIEKNLGNQEEAAKLIEIFEREGLPSMQKQTVTAWRKNGLNSQHIRESVVDWLSEKIHPAPEGRDELLAACLERGLMPTLG